MTTPPADPLPPDVEQTLRAQAVKLSMVTGSGAPVEWLSRDIYTALSAAYRLALASRQEEIERLKKQPVRTGCDECLDARRAQAEQITTLQAENARLLLERDSAKEQFDKHVEWASTEISRVGAQRDAAEAQLREASYATIYERMTEAEAQLREARATALEDAAKHMVRGWPLSTAEANWLRARAASERKEGAS
jgi:hypothetical protein